MSAALTAYGKQLFATAAQSGNATGVLNSLLLALGSGSVELSGAGYARQSLSGVWAAPALGVAVTNADVVFPTATGGSQGTPSQAAYHDGTDFVTEWGTTGVAEELTEGKRFRAPAGDLSISWVNPGV